MDLHWGIILQIIQKVFVLLLRSSVIIRCLSVHRFTVELFRIVSRQACADPETLKNCSEWLKGSVLGEQLLGLIGELCKVERCSPISTSSPSDHRWMLISLVLSQYHNNGKTAAHWQIFFLPKEVHTFSYVTKIFALNSARQSL